MSPGEKGGRRHRKGNQTKKEEKTMNSHHQPYPEMADAMHCAGELFALWKAGTLMDNLSLSVKHADTVERYGKLMVFGEPDNPLIGAAMKAEGPPLGETELMANLESFSASRPETVGAKAVPWPLILAALKMLLEKWLKKE